MKKKTRMCPTLLTVKYFRKELIRIDALTNTNRKPNLHYLLQLKFEFCIIFFTIVRWYAIYI